MRLIQAGEASETKARASKVFDPLDTVLESDRVVAADGNEAEPRVLDSETSPTFAATSFNHATTGGGAHPRPEARSALPLPVGSFEGALSHNCAGSKITIFNRSICL